MLSRLILAAVAVAAVGIWPRSRISAALAFAAGTVSVLIAGWGVAADTLRATGPMLIFLTSALTIASLAERAGQAPLFLGAVGVANAVSLSVPEGNPTNLVVMSRLGLSTSAFLEHLLVPGLCAGVLCALVPLRRLARESRIDTLVVNAAPIFVPWRIGAQMAGLVAALDRLAPAVSLRGGGLVTPL